MDYKLVVYLEALIGEINKLSGSITYSYQCRAKGEEVAESVVVEFGSIQSLCYDVVVEVHIQHSAIVHELDFTSNAVDVGSCFGFNSVAMYVDVFAVVCYACIGIFGIE